MRYRDLPRWAIREAIVLAARKQDALVFERRLRGLINQVKNGALPVTVLDRIERDYPHRWKMIAQARREVEYGA